MTNLFGKQTVHDKEHNTLKAAKNGEQVRHGYSAFLKLETTKDPHDAQNAQLSHCSNGECPAGGNKDAYMSCARYFGEAIDYVILSTQQLHGAFSVGSLSCDLLYFVQIIKIRV